MKPFKQIESPQLQTMLEGETVTLLDCRELKDYRMGHIDGAMHLHEQLRESLLKKGDRAGQVVIYCYFGHASEHVAEMFADFGFNDVYSLQGGFSAWKEFTKVTAD